MSLMKNHFRAHKASIDVAKALFKQEKNLSEKNGDTL